SSDGAMGSRGRAQAHLIRDRCARLSQPPNVSSATPRAPAPRHHSQQQKDIEISECRCLLLTQILERLQGQLLRSNRIAGLLQEPSPRLLEEGNYSLVERIEGLAKPQGVKLVTAFLQRLRHGRPDAASLVAQQTQQANGRST